MKGSYIVVYTGDLLPDADFGNVVLKTTKLFQISAHQARSFIYGNKPCIIKKGISRDLAAQYKKRMEKIGLQVIIRDQGACAGNCM